MDSDGWFLWHPFGLKLKAAYHVHGPSPPTNESHGFSKAKDHLVGDVSNSRAVNQSAIITRSKASGFRWGVKEWKIAAVKNPGRRKTST